MKKFGYQRTIEWEDGEQIGCINAIDEQMAIMCATGVLCRMFKEKNNTFDDLEEWLYMARNAEDELYLKTDNIH